MKEEIGNKWLKGKLGDDVFYLTNAFGQKERQDLSLILNKISKAKSLEYHIKMVTDLNSDKVYLHFSGSPRFREKVWTLEKLGGYVGMQIMKEVDECITIRDIKDISELISIDLIGSEITEIERHGPDNDIVGLVVITKDLLKVHLAPTMIGTLKEKKIGMVEREWEGLSK